MPPKTITPKVEALEALDSRSYTGRICLLNLKMNLELSEIFLPLLRAQMLTRHVMLPKDTAKIIPTTRLLSEDEWRSLGVQQSRGWQHYAIHR